MKDNKMTSPEKAKSGHKGHIRSENRRVILKAAEEVFSEAGFKGATTSAIAKKAGLPKANVHFYFPTKEGLYRDVLDDIVNTWFEAASYFGEHGEPAETLRRYIGAKMELSRQRPLGSKIFATEIIHGAPIMDEALWDKLKPWFDGCVRRIDEWITDGKIDPIEPKILMYMIWATTQHYADFARQIEVLNDDKALSDAQFAGATEQVIKIILKGLGVSET